MFCLLACLLLEGGFGQNTVQWWEAGPQMVLPVGFGATTVSACPLKEAGSARPVFALQASICSALCLINLKPPV